MRHLVILPSKSSDEATDAVITFMDRLQFAENIGGAATIVSVFSGVDPNPSAILNGSATYTNKVFTQSLQDGVPGVTYQLNFFVSTVLGHLYCKTAFLSIATTESIYP